MNLSKAALRIRARGIFQLEYCFAPPLKDIILLESSGDGEYIRCSVGYYEYVIEGQQVTDKLPLYDYDGVEGGDEL